MLQKSRSKLKYLFMVPISLAMLTIVSCSQESPDVKNNKDSLSEHLRIVNESLKDGAELTEQEYIILLELRENIKIAIYKNQQSGKFPNTDKLIATEQYSNGAGVPFSVVDQVPVYPGCEDASSNEEKKKCMLEKVAAYLSENFDGALAEQLGFKGTIRMYVVFKIGLEGNITDVRARAAHPDLVEEAKRVIKGLPNMTPGKNKGQNVEVSYSLPILFQVNE